MALGKVFLSSTFKELMRWRKKAAEGIEAAGHDCILMENIASNDPPEIACAREVRNSDLYVLLLGISYGSCPEDGTQLSYTEAEFRASLLGPTPRLVFTGDPEGYAVPSGVVEGLAQHGLPDQMAKVNKLKAAASAGRTPTYFTTPEDLRTKVEDSVRRHFAANPVSEPQQAEQSPVGELVPFLCDRSGQDIDFRTVLDSAGRVCPRLPLVWVIHGFSDQQHENCVRALVWRHVEKERATSGVVFQPSPLNKHFVQWPKPDSLITSMYKRLIGHLLLTVDHNADLSRLDAERFCEVAAAKGVPYLVLRHPIRVWNERTEQLIRTKYLPFWDEVGKNCESDRWKWLPRILVFFEVEYERGPDGTPPQEIVDKLDKSFQSRKRAFASLSTNCRCAVHVLEALPDVEKIDYDNWTKRYNDVLPFTLRNLNFHQEFGLRVTMAEFEQRIQSLLGRRT